MAEMDVSGSFAGESAEQPSRAKQVMHQGKEKAAEATGAVRQKAFAKVDERKGELAETLDRLARQLDEFGEGLSGPESRVAGAISGAVRKAHGLINERSTDELARAAIDELKQRPAAIIAGCFALGFLGSRLLKS